jgi:scyllo-inositol 2-dehydrogenase (NADP+)
MRVGIIGYGVAGRIFHGGLLRREPSAEVVAVVTRDAERRAQVAEDFPEAVCRDDVDDMLGADHIDLAVVASPTAYHIDNALECLAFGVPTVIDKPAATTAEQARRIATTGVTVFQNRRWDSEFLTLRRLRDQGELGRILRFESRFERWRPKLTPGKWREELTPEKGGGTLLDLGSHLVDQAVQLLGPVRAVYAEVFHRREAPADDDVFLALRHDNDAVSHLSCGNLAAAPGPRLRVLGTRAAFTVEDLDGQEDALRDGRSPDEARTPEGRLHQGDVSAPVVLESGRWLDFYPAVFAAVETGSAMPVSPVDSVHVLEVLDAARAAAAASAVIQLR